MGALERLPPEILFGKIIPEVRALPDHGATLRNLYAAAPSLFYREFGGLLRQLTGAEQAGALTDTDQVLLQHGRGALFEKSMLQQMAFFLDDDIAFPQHCDTIPTSLKDIFSARSKSLVLGGPINIHAKGPWVVKSRMPRELVTLTALQDLTLGFPLLDEPLNLGFLAALPHLKSLALDGQCSAKVFFPKNLRLLNHLVALRLSYFADDLPYRKVVGDFPDFSHFKFLKDLSLNGCRLTCIPDEIGTLEALEGLNLSENRLADGDDQDAALIVLPKLKKLTRLNLRHNRFSAWPKVLEQCAGLEELILLGAIHSQHEGQRVALPLLRNLKSLIKLDISYLDIGEIPAELHDLPRLRHLRAINIGATSMPQSLFNMPQMTDVDLSENRFTQGVNLLTQAHHLQKLRLRSCRTLQARDMVQLAAGLTALPALRFAHISARLSMDHFIKSGAESCLVSCDLEENHIEVFGSAVLKHKENEQVVFPVTLWGDVACAYRTTLGLSHLRYC